MYSNFPTINSLGTWRRYSIIDSSYAGSKGKKKILQYVINSMDKNVRILSVSGVKIQEISRESKYVLIEWYFSKNNEVNEKMLLAN